jgi:ERF superfamily protein
VSAELEVLPPSGDGSALMRIIERAAALPEFDLDRLEKLLALKTKWDEAQALREYARGMVAFKKDRPEIFKNKHVSFGTTNYDHATHDEVTDKLSDALARYGFTHAWYMKQTENKITVTCELTHISGHTGSAELTAVNDGSGGKNSIQAIASANSYLQRYTLLAVTGTSTKDMPNDDGRPLIEKEPAPQVPKDIWEALENGVHGGPEVLAEVWRVIPNDTRKVIVTHYSDKWNDMKAASLIAGNPKK